MSFAQRWHDIRSRLRAALLGRQHQRTVRAALLLRGVRVTGALPARGPCSFPRSRPARSRGFFGGLVWFLPVFGGTLADRMGFRRALALAYLILACRYFLMGSLGATWLLPVAKRHAFGSAGGLRPGASGLRYRLGKADGCRHHRARLQRKCPLHGLLHLLHAGEYRRRGGSLRRFVRASHHERGKCLPGSGAERLPHVPRRAHLLP